MELLELQDNAMVRAADGKALGEIERFVVNPSNREVTHLVVKEGLIFKDRRIVPVEMIDRVDEEGPVLVTDIEPDELEPFATEHYVSVDDVTRDRFDPALGEASIWRYPTLGTGFYPGYPGMAVPYGPVTTKVRDLNVPAGAAIVDQRTPVELASGKAIGSVTEVAVTEEGDLSHLIVELDSLDGERVVPAHWIDTITEDRIVLAVGEGVLRHLEQAD